jgi:hypothetical protein
MLADDLDELECHLGPVTAKLCKMAIWACVAAGPLAAVW